MRIVTSYASQERWLPSGRAYIGPVLGLMLLGALPYIVPEYWIYFACLLGINIIAATGLNIITGYAGLLSLGHAAFMGVGAYTAALLSAHFGLSILVTIPAAGFLAMLIGAAFGLPSLRITGLYLVVATLAAQFVLEFVFIHWESLTGGDVGLTVASAKLFNFTLTKDVHFYYVITLLSVVLTLFAANLVRSRTGRAFVAVREQGHTAEVLGVNVVKYKLLAFMVGSFYAGVAGALMAYFNSFVNPDQFGLHLSIFFLAAVIIGGMGSMLGVVLGAAFMTIIPELLGSSVDSLSAVLNFNVSNRLRPLTELIFGFLIVMFLIFEPQGLARIWRRCVNTVHAWPLRF